MALRRLALTLAIYMPSHTARVQLIGRLQSWRPLGLSLVLLCLCGLVPLELAKVLWGRARPYMVLPGVCLHTASASGASYPQSEERDCGYGDWKPSSHCLDFVAETGHQQFDCAFSGWWHPNGFRSGLYSFPSGHTFSGWLLLPIALHWRELPRASQSWRSFHGSTAAAYAVIVGWGVLVGAPH